MKKYLKIASIKTNYLILIPIILAVVVLSLKINKPFVGQHDFNGVQFGNAAKNYLKYGPLQLKFGMVTSKIHGDFRSSKSFYTSYLPTLPLLIFLSYKLFGISDFAVRLIPSIFSLLSVIFLFLLTKKLWGNKAATLASLFFVFNPMFIYYSNIPIPDILVLSMMILSIYCYIRYQKERKVKNLIFLLVVVFLSGLMGWISIYLGPIFLLHSLIIKKFDRNILVLNTILLFTVLLQFIHNFILSGHLLEGSMFSSLQKRLFEKSLSFGGEEFTVLNYVRRQMNIFQAFFTRTIICLSVFTTIKYLTDLKWGKTIDFNKGIILVLLLLGLGHPIIFTKAVFIHDYQNIYLLPFLSISAGLALTMLLNFFLKKGLNKIMANLFIILIFVVFIFERIEFSKTLNLTNMNKQGQEMANLLNNLQIKDDQAIIASPRFNSFYGIFTDYYSNFTYQSGSEKELKDDDPDFKYKYIITFEEDINDKQFFETLKTRFNYQQFGSVAIFTTDAKI